ncbi:MAG: OmpP1/FadL family transporter [Thiotrichales bacterium]
MNCPIHAGAVTRRFPRRTLALVTLLTLGTGVHATNGYSPIGFGTTNKGMAGVGVALPQDALTSATNPAGVVHLANQLDVGLALFMPNRGFTANDYTDPDPFTPPQSILPGSYNSDIDLFLIPSVGYIRHIDAASTLSVALSGNGGMNTEYDAAVWSNFGPASSPTGVDLAQVFLGVTYARKLDPTHAVGIMPILAFQRFKAEGLEPFRMLSVSPDHVTNNGYDTSWGYGARIGWLGNFDGGWRAGASYQTKLQMEAFDDYRGLFADGGNFDVPSTLVGGVSYAVNPSVTIAFDWQRIFYSDVKSLHNSNATPLTSPANFLGARDGLGFGWDDIDIFKLGVQWVRSPVWTYRAGISHASQLFDNGESLFNVLAPATVRTHASLGLTYRPNPKHAIQAAYTRAFNERISGDNPAFTGGQTGFVEMDQHEIEVSWSYRF